jgi:hypothetical protein
MPLHTCPTCGKPTADGEVYGEIHNTDYCSPITSPDCWGEPSGPVHYLVDLMTDGTACGSDEGAGSSTDEGSVTCPDCLARM